MTTWHAQATAPADGGDDYVARVSTALLEHAATTQYHFERLWSALSSLLTQLFTWPHARDVDTPQSLTNTLAHAQLLVYHAVAHPCIGVPTPPRLRGAAGRSGRYSENACAMTVLQERLELQCRHHLEHRVARDVDVHAHAFTQLLERHPAAAAGDNDSSMTAASRHDDDDSDGGVVVDAAMQLLLSHVRHWRLYSVTVVQLQAVFAPVATTWRALGFSETALRRTETIALQQWASVVLTEATCNAMAHAVRVLMRRIRHVSVAFAAAGADTAARAVADDGDKDDADAHARMCGVLTELKDELLMLPDHTQYEVIVERACLCDVRAYYASTLQRVAMRSNSSHADSTNSSSGRRTLGAYARQCLCAIDRERAFAARFLKPYSHIVANVVHMLVDERLHEVCAADLEQLMGSDDTSECDGNTSGDGSDDNADDAHAVYALFALSPHAALPLLLRSFVAHTQRTTATALLHAIAATATTAVACDVAVCNAVIRCLVARVTALRRRIGAVFDGDVRFLQQMEDGLLGGLQLALRERGVDVRVLAQQLAVFAHAGLRACAGRHNDHDDDDDDEDKDDGNATEATRCCRAVVDDVVAVYFFLPRLCAGADEAFLLAHRDHLAARLLAGCYHAAAERNLLERIALTHTSALLFCCRSMLQSTRMGTLRVSCSHSNDEGDDARCAALCAWVLPSYVWLTHERTAMRTTPQLRMPHVLQQLVTAAHTACAARRPHHHLTLSHEYTTATVRLQPSWWLRQQQQQPAVSGAVTHSSSSSSSQPTLRVRVSLLQLCILDALARCASWRLDALCAELCVGAAACVAALQPLLAACVVAKDDGADALRDAAAAATAAVVVVRRGDGGRGSCCGDGNSSNSGGSGGLLDVVPDAVTSSSSSSSTAALASSSWPAATEASTIDKAAGDDADAAAQQQQQQYVRRAAEAHVVAVLKRRGALSLPVLLRHLDSVLAPARMHVRTLKLCLDRLCERGLVARVDDTDVFAYVP